MEKILETDVITVVAQAIPHLLRLPSHQLYVDYDQEADVLYISFARPQQATDSQMTDDGYVLHYRDDKVVGITVLEASTRP